MHVFLRHNPNSIFKQFQICTSILMQQTSHERRIYKSSQQLVNNQITLQEFLQQLWIYILAILKQIDNAIFDYSILSPESMRKIIDDLLLLKNRCQLW